MAYFASSRYQEKKTLSPFLYSERVKRILISNMKLSSFSSVVAMYLYMLSSVFEKVNVKEINTQNILVYCIAFAKLNTYIYMYHHS